MFTGLTNLLKTCICTKIASLGLFGATVFRIESYVLGSGIVSDRDFGSMNPTRENHKIHQLQSDSFAVVFLKYIYIKPFLVPASQI